MRALFKVLAIVLVIEHGIASAMHPPPDNPVLPGKLVELTQMLPGTDKKIRVFMFHFGNGTGVASGSVTNNHEQGTVTDAQNSSIPITEIKSNATEAQEITAASVPVNATKVEMFLSNAGLEIPKASNSSTYVTSVNSSAALPLDHENEINGDEHDNEIPGSHVWRSPVHLERVEATGEAKKLDPKVELGNIVERLEKEAEQRLHVCYLKIALLNDYKYQLEQVKQYLHLSKADLNKNEQRLQKMKLEVQVAYVRCRASMNTLEKYRSKLTTWPNDNSKTIVSYMRFFPQPKVIPEIWYLFYNLESIIMQLFTPKPRICTFYDEESHSIQMARTPTVMMIPRHFIPVPQYNEPIQPTVNLTRLFGDNQALDSEGDPFHTAKFSKDPFEQQVIMYYLANYYRYKASDSARCVRMITDKLAALQAISKADKSEEIGRWKVRLADTLKEMRYAAYQMQAYKEDMELTHVYKAEEAAIPFLEDEKHITKLEGDDIKRVAIMTRAEALAAFEPTSESDKANHSNDIESTVSVPDPLEWDANQVWDF